MAFIMRGKKVLWLIGIGTISALLGLYWLVQYLLSPYRAYAQFLDAIEKKDVERIYAFVLDEEKQYGLTKETIKHLLDWMLYRNAQKLRGETNLIDPPADRWFRTGVVWVNGETGKTLTINGLKLVGYINLFRPPKRWRWQVSFTHFVKDYLYLNTVPLILRQQGWTEEAQLADYERYQRLREDMVAKWLKQLGISKVFPLPAKTKMRGRYVVIWKK